MAKKVADNSETGGARAEPHNGVRAIRRSEKVSETVAREIVHDIVARAVAPGAMLPPESIMLRQYGVGRASLREALRLLEVHGLIVIKPGPGGGPMVAGADSRHFGRMATLYLHMSSATFEDLIQARLVMEPVMARLAAERQDPQSMERLQRFVTGGTPDPTDDGAYLEVATEFHAMLSGMSGNPVLDLFGRAIKDIHTDRVRGMVFPPEDRERVNHEHVEIAKAIIQGKAPRAERLMREHMIEFVDVAALRHPGMLDEIVDWR